MNLKESSLAFFMGAGIHNIDDLQKTSIKNQEKVRKQRDQ